MERLSAERQSSLGIMLLPLRTAFTGEWSIKNSYYIALVRFTSFPWIHVPIHHKRVLNLCKFRRGEPRPRGRMWIWKGYRFFFKSSLIKRLCLCSLYFEKAVKGSNETKDSVTKKIPTYREFLCNRVALYIILDILKRNQSMSWTNVNALLRRAPYARWRIEMLQADFSTKFSFSVETYNTRFEKTQR